MKGHNICGHCFGNDMFNHQCGICRMAITDEIRNRALEQLLKKQQVFCKIIECDKVMSYGKLVEQHLPTECKWVKVACKYQDYGCKWMGHRGKLNNHEHQTINYEKLFNENCVLKSENNKLEEELNHFRVQQYQAQRDEMLRGIVLHSQLTRFWRFKLIKRHFNGIEIKKQFDNVHWVSQHYVSLHYVPITLSMGLRFDYDLQERSVEMNYCYKINWQSSMVNVLKALFVFKQEEDEGEELMTKHHQIMRKVDYTTTYRSTSFISIYHQKFENIDALNHFLDDDTDIVIQVYVKLEG